jgi:hypothetical protein
MVCFLNSHFLQEKAAETTHQKGKKEENEKTPEAKAEQGDTPQHRHCPRACAVHVS